MSRRRFLVPGLLTLPLAAALAAAPVAQAGSQLTTTRNGYAVDIRPGETWTQAHARQSTVLGRPEVVRFYYGSAALSWPAGGGFAGSTPLVVSFNRDPAAVAAGRYDAEIRTFLGKLPRDRPTYVALNHEMDAKIVHGAYSAATARSAWIRFATLANQTGNPMIKKTLILTGWKYRERLAPLWPGGAYVDVLGVDIFQWESWQTPQSLFDEDLRIAAEYGKPIAVPEFGVWTGSDATKANFINSVDLYLRGKVEFISYYEDDMSMNAGDHDWRISPLPASAAAWRTATAR